MIRKEIRILGIDDAPFNQQKKTDVTVICTVYRGGNFFDGILSTKIRKDGSNSTPKLIKAINSSKFKPQLRCIMTDGIALGGFNIIDVKKLYKATKIPIIIVIRRKPDLEKIKTTLKNLGMSQKYKLIENAGKIYHIDKLYVQLVGLDLETAKKILKITCVRSIIPEPIRIAHLIASGVTEGESRGRA